MAEPPPSSINIQPTTKLGGRGTPRRKTRRPSNTNHSASVAARTLENKLKPFRTQFQLQDQQELCDVTILYEDGHIELQKQVHVHSTWPMTIHEIDSPEAGLQTYHINELDSTSLEYLFGNLNNLDNQQINSSNYYNDLQQRQFYSQPSRYYMNYVAYQQNPYASNSYDNYSNNIQQVYGGVNNTQSDDDELIEKPSKRKRRRRKHAKTTSEQEPSVNLPPLPPPPPTREGHLENENSDISKPKRKRRRIRKSKKSKIDISSSSSSSLQPSTEHVKLQEKQELVSTKPDIYANGNAFMNMEKKIEIEPRECRMRTVDDITPTTHTYIPTVEVIDVDKREEENEKITLPDIDNTSTNNISSTMINNEIPDSNHNQVKYFRRLIVVDFILTLK
jgi:hypothetical protein